MYWLDVHDENNKFMFRIETEKPLMVSIEPDEPAKVNIFLNGNSSMTFYRAELKTVFVEQSYHSIEIEREQKSG